MLETIRASRSSQEFCQETKRINQGKQMQQVAPTFINEQSQISPSFTMQDTCVSKETFATNLARSAYCLLTKNISFPRAQLRNNQWLRQALLPSKITD